MGGQAIKIFFIKSGNLKLGWWMDFITCAKEKWPPIRCEPHDPFFGLYLPDFIIHLWWGIN
jgi:hypothetical protein